MVNFIEQNITTLYRAIIYYFSFLITKRLKEIAIYHFDLSVYLKITVFIKNNESSELFINKEAVYTEFIVNLINKYYKKLIPKDPL